MFVINNSQEGMTLIEIMISILILGVIAVPIFVFFTGSFINIHVLGERSRANTLASNEFENLRVFLEDGDDGFRIDDLTEKLKENGFSPKTCEDLKNAEPDNEEKWFCVEQFSSEGLRPGAKITLKIFYQNGKQHITLTSFIRGREADE